MGTTQKCCVLFGTNSERSSWRSKYKHISDILLWTPTHGHTSVGQPAKAPIHQLCADTGYYQEDLSRAMTDRDG